jgi:hypothetical protein
MKHPGTGLPRRRTERGFAVGSTLFVRDDRYAQWRSVEGTKAEAALRMLTDALAAVVRSGWEVRQVRGTPNHAHVFVHRESRSLNTWLYEPGAAGKTCHRVAGRAFTVDEFQRLMEL